MIGNRLFTTARASPRLQAIATNRACRVPVAPTTFGKNLRICMEHRGAIAEPVATANRSSITPGAASTIIVIGDQSH
jgi:hypothetical protein